MASEGIFVHACEGMASLAAAVAAAGGDAGKLSGRTVGEACDTITPLFCSLGMALKFAGDDFTSKATALVERASESTLDSAIDADIAAGTVKNKGSVTRDLLRLTRGLAFICNFIEQLIKADPSEESMVDPIWAAYEKELAPYHPWVLQQTVKAGVYMVPYRSATLEAWGLSEEKGQEVGPGVVANIKTSVDALRALFTGARALGTEW